MFRDEYGTNYSKCRATGIPMIAQGPSDRDLYVYEHEEMRRNLAACRAALKTIADATFPEDQDSIAYSQKLAQNFLSCILLAELTINSTSTEGDS